MNAWNKDYLLMGFDYTIIVIVNDLFDLMNEIFGIAHIILEHTSFT